MGFASVLQLRNQRLRDGASISNRSLENRVVILTGGAGLLGRNHAETLSAAGAHTVVADIRGDGANDVVETLSGAEGMAAQVDIANPESVQDMIESVVDRFGRIDALVNNAALDPKFDAKSGLDPRAPAGARMNAFENYPLEAWRRSLDVDLTGAFLCTQAAAPHLLASGRGSVVNIASIYGLTGPDQRLYQENGEQVDFKPVAYSVTKSALTGFTRYLAAYWAGKVRVNTLTLGGVEAEQGEAFIRRYSERTPMGRMASPDEYGGALVFLLSDASSYMTGSNLVVDGGWTAW